MLRVSRTVVMIAIYQKQIRLVFLIKFVSAIYRAAVSMETTDGLADPVVVAVVVVVVAVVVVDSRPRLG